MSDIPTGPADGGEEIGADEIEIEDGQDGDGEIPGEDGEGAGSEAGAEEGSGDEVDAPPQRSGRPGRSERYRAENERLRQELAEAKGFQRAAEQFQTQARAQQGPSPAELAEQHRREQEQLSMMSPQEVAAYYYNKAQREVQQAMLYQSLQTEDRIDKQAYDISATTSKFHRDHKSEVERRLVAERNAGNLRATRATILAQIVGEEAMQRGSADSGRQRSAAAGRVRSQQTRPTNGRSDSAGGGKRGTWGDPEFDARMAAEAMRKGMF